ncbi:MAG: hypothetical protein RL752_884 [Actinomycetota bacterium]
MFAAVEDAGLCHLNFIWSGECHQFLASLDAESWKIIAGPIRPFEVDLSEAWILLGGAAVFLEVFHVATEGAVDAVFGDQDAAL